MRDYKNRIAAMLQKAMRETALTKLKALQAAHVDATNGKMFDGPRGKSRPTRCEDTFNGLQRP